MACQRVAVVVAGSHAEAFAEALESEGAISIDIADAEAGTEREAAIFGEPGAGAAMWAQCRVTSLFPAGDDASAALERALATSATHALAGASVDRLEDADWVARTQRDFAPMQVGRRLWIVPTWHAPPQPEAVNIVLDPGAAFGTGSHPTTQLCLAWLERNVSSATSVLDYGCGSGILGIAALKLGASSAIGVDIDPLALEAASYNARRNDVPLRVLAASSEFDEAADLTVANILANPLRMLAPLIAAHTLVGGRIALSGILESQADEVVAAYRAWCALEIEGRDAGWVLLSGVRRA